MTLLGGGTYWFVSALIVCELIIIVLLSTRIKNIWFYFCLLSSLSLLGISGALNSDFNLYAYQQSLLACVFIGAGGVYWKYEKEVDVIKPYVWFALLVFYVLFLYLFPDRALTLVSLNSLNLIGIILSIIGCVLFIWFCKLIPQIVYFSFLGRNTLLFYIMSGALPICLNILFKHFFPSITLIGFLAFWIGTLFLGSIITYLISKYCYFLLDIRTINKRI